MACCWDDQIVVANQFVERLLRHQLTQNFLLALYMDKADLLRVTAV